jgi:hypothetical protein
MAPVAQQLQLLLMMFASWINRQQLKLIEYSPVPDVAVAGILVTAFVADHPREKPCPGSTAKDHGRWSEPGNGPSRTPCNPTVPAMVLTAPSGVILRIATNASAPLERKVSQHYSGACG